MTWSYEDTTKLIDLYREREVLYDWKNPLYYNRVARRADLEEIKNSLVKIRPGTTVGDVKSKLNSLRTQFNRDYHRLRNLPSGSVHVYKPKQWCFTQLLFLQEFVKPRESAPNVHSCGDNNEEMVGDDGATFIDDTIMKVLEKYRNSKPRLLESLLKEYIG